MKKIKLTHAATKLFTLFIYLSISAYVLIFSQVQEGSNQSSPQETKHQKLQSKLKSLSNERITIADNNYASINQMKLYVSNTSTGSVELRDWAAAWPGGRNAFKNIVFFDGLQLVGRIDGELTCIGIDPLYFGGTSNLRPGKIFDDGSPADPSDSKYRIYRIQKGWETTPFGTLRDQLERDYNLWPVEDGAPWIDIDGDGFFSRGIDQPNFLGDEVLFYVSNDVDSSLKPIDRYFNRRLKPLNVEVQLTVFAMQGVGALGDVVFRRYKIINKGIKPIKDLYVSFFSDTDVGDFLRDLGACDTTLDLGYLYKGVNNDAVFGTELPAVGHVLVQGPRVPALASDSAYFNGKWIKGYKNLRMTSFNYYGAPFNNTDLPDSIFFKYKYKTPSHVVGLYNTVRGKLHSGEPQLGPDGKPTPYALSGDPVNNTGWYDSPEAWPGYDSLSVGPNEKLYQLNAGPIELAPFDTNEVVIALVAAIGEDRLDSITELKKKVKAIRTAYYSNFKFIKPPPKPLVHSFEDDKVVNLWWENNAESYDEFDLLLEGHDVADSTYTFEGYIIEQFENELGTNPTPIGIVDRINGVTVIESFVIANGVSVKLPVIYGSDSGLKRFIMLEKDYYTNEPLLSGAPYYFGVSAYAYSRYSDPSFIKSESSIVKIIPGKPKIDFTSSYKIFEKVNTNQKVGISDANVLTKIIDPTYIKGHKYNIVINEMPLGLTYSMIRQSDNDTLINNSYAVNLDSITKPIFDGFIPLFYNYGLDSINSIDPNRTYAVKEILEIRNEEGYLDTPTKILNNYNSTNKWKFRIGGVQFPRKSHLNYAENIGYNTYEIRFTEEGSEYYTTGYSPLFFFRNDDPKGKGRLPFEVWQVSRDGTESKRLIIKVFDQTLRDTTWTKDETTNMWERFYCYEPEGEYPEVLPETSGRSLSAQHRIGNIVFEGEQPEEETIIRITTFRPLSDGDEFEIQLEAPNFNDTESGKEKIDEISVFPNPFFAGNNITNQNYVRFIGLPTKATIRIFTISGQQVRRLEKDDQTKYADWDLRNESNQIVAGGMYIAHIDMPAIGTKVLKVAIIPSKEFLDIR